MTASNVTALFHVLGFLTASVLYVMLAVMTSSAHAPERAEVGGRRDRSDRIPFATAILGLVWNAGEVVLYGLHATATAAPEWLAVLSFAALSYLPAVVVHSALAGPTWRSPSVGHQSAARGLTGAAYAASTMAVVLNVIAAARHQPVPSHGSSLVLSVGFVSVVAVLTIYAARLSASRRALPVVAVAVFAVMLIHLTDHAAGSEPWLVELVGHHGSLLVVLVILYQDYRFALADLFLKRALTLLALTALATALYAGVVVPLLVPRQGFTTGTTDPIVAAAFVALWVGTALIYPRLRRAVGRFVDRAVLRRADTGQLITTLAGEVSGSASADAVLDAACRALAPALSAARTTWAIAGESEEGVSRQPTAPMPATPRLPVVIAGARGAVVHVATVDTPSYTISVAGLSGGRRLLSDDYALLESVGQVVGRRIDLLRVADERYQRDVREQQIRRLATEAELRALRAQLNPHFLFNALTTIGHLVSEAPDRALETLFRLTEVLRAVLKRSDGEFTTLGDEMDIVSAYLAIERVRFEDRLLVTTDIAPELARLRIPPLVIQPVVENAVKHGIAPLARGGHITIAARTEWTTAISGAGPDSPRCLRLTVTDTGQGAEPREMANRRRSGIGLSNIERRLERYFGEAASLDIRSAVGVGTTVDIRLPLIGRDLSRVGA